MITLKMASPRSAVTLPVDMISNANSGESRPDANVPAFRVEKS
jgi:hypothetical protein